MELRTYLAILWRRKLVILIVAGLVGTIVNIGTLMMTPVYVGSTTLRVSRATSVSPDEPRYDSRYADRLMNSYAKITNSRPVLAEV